SRLYEAFAAYRNELAYHLAMRGHAQVLVLAPKLHALAAKLQPPPLVPANLETQFETARKGLDEARTKDDLSKASASFLACAQLAPWLPEVYYYLSVAENAADELRAAEKHLQVYLAMKPDAANDASVQKLQTGLRQSIAPMSGWENSLGMRFIPLPGTTVRCSIWETREKDYSLFVKDTGRPWDKKHTPDSSGWKPATVVNLYDAAAFCDWLTQKERRDGLIGEHDYYRLPTQEEWTLAAGTVSGPFPWGATWPPPPGAGNFRGGEIRERYEKLRAAGLVSAKTMTEDSGGIEGYEDAFATHSPVGSFEPNAQGLYDLAGNAWEWCAGTMADVALPMFASDEKSALGFARGGSYSTDDKETAATLYKKVMPAFESLYEDTGFRCVLAREFTLMSLHEVSDTPVEESLPLREFGIDQPGHARAKPLIMTHNLLSMAISSSWHSTKMEIEFESQDERLRDPVGWRKGRRILLMLGGGKPVDTFLVAEHGLMVEDATRRIKITCASLDDLNRVKALLEPRLSPRH
ncbi:MAG: SUMF1/EgtB/PvdO family nonheme iron enzyme, partial [Prosthecobacter sp.]|nr:SUMF1/EgtB/PvdO family nonheme iron enzyme [Prosthecobacter sp.]